MVNVLLKCDVCGEEMYGHYTYPDHYEPCEVENADYLFDLSIHSGMKYNFNAMTMEHIYLVWLQPDVIETHPTEGQRGIYILENAK